MITQLFHSQYSYEIGLPCEIFEQVFPFSVQNMVCSLCTLHGMSRSSSFVHSLALDVGRYVGKSLIVVASTGSWRFGSRWYRPSPHPVGGAMNVKREGTMQTRVTSKNHRKFIDYHRDI